MEKSFDVVIETDRKNNQFYASVPLLPGCYSYASSMPELLDNIKEAIELHLETLKIKKHEIEDNKVLGMVKVSV